MLNIQIHGHRGCRGLMPENTIAGFLHAIDLGVDAIEMDIVVNGEGQLLVSHEPWISPRICLDMNDEFLPEGMTERLNLFKMDMVQIKKYDCGLKPHPDFPDQKKLAATKPLLSEVIDEVEAYLDQNGKRTIGYNIEIKSKEKWYGTFQPGPGPFAQLLLDLLHKKQIQDRCIVQCFDPQILRALKNTAPELPLALLVKNSNGLEANLDLLGFVPEYYSPHSSLVNSVSVAQLKAKGMKWLVWTVNEMEDIKRMVELKPDGVITDFPTRVMAAIKT